MSNVSRDQLKRLQTLYSAYARHDIDPMTNLRSQRLLWASRAIGRTISTFSDLTRAEANSLIDTLQTALNQPYEPPRHRVRDAYAAQSAGSEGRRGDRGPKTMVSQRSLDRIQESYGRLGWTPSRFEAWLQSPSSPLRGRTSIVTEGDANRVWWALKNMLKTAGFWEERA